jgi:transposase-like protein
VQARIAPSVQIEAEIESLLLDGLEGGGDTDDLQRLSKLGRLGAQLVFQRAIEDEVEAFLRRARFERTPAARGSRNGHRPRRIATAEGPITIAVPQVRDSLTRFVSSVIPDCRTAIRTRPLEALVIGAYVRGLSDRDIESLAAEAGLGHIGRTAVSGICSELRDRYRAFRAKSLADVGLLSLMLDAIYLPVRPDGPKEGVLVAWGYTLEGERVLLDVCLGQRERTEDWLDLGRGLAARGLASPLLRNVLAKLPKKPLLHEKVRRAYWAALDGATTPQEAQGRLRAIVGELERDYPSAAACLADDLPALTVHLAYPLALRKRLRSTNLLERSLEEVRRRTKVIGRFPGETSCLTLAWAVMDLVIAGARGLAVSGPERGAIAALVAAARSVPDARQVA